MPSHLSPARVRLGEMLVRRRIELDPRYRNRRTFVAERASGLYRIVNDIELGRWGKRTAFEPGTIAALEDAYALQAGAIKRALDGGDLEPRDAAPTSTAIPRDDSGVYAEVDEVGAMLYQPVIRLRLADLAKDGDVRPSGEALFLEDGDPLGAGPEVAEGLARRVDRRDGPGPGPGPGCPVRREGVGTDRRLPGPSGRPQHRPERRLSSQIERRCRNAGHVPASYW